MKMKYATKVAVGLAVLMLAAAVVEAAENEDVSAAPPKIRKRRWFGLRKALPDGEKQEAQFGVPGLMIVLSGLIIAGVGASLIAKNADSNKNAESKKVPTEADTMKMKVRVIGLGLLDSDWTSQKPYV